MKQYLQKLNIARQYRERAYQRLAQGVECPDFLPETILGLGFSSQCGQDKWLTEEIFPGKTDGVFVDIGAHDGVTFSNTFYLEKELGWKGLAIEPMPDAFQRLCDSRDCIKVQGCISASQGVSRFRKISGYSEMLSGLVDRYDPRHLQRIEREIAAHGGTSEEIAVQCYRLNDLLKQHRISEVHYLNVDVEGAELEILRSIDFRSANILVCGVENNYRDYRIPRLMKNSGYRMKAIVGDEFYLREDVVIG